MSEKLYTVSLKGQKPSDPWTVVNADSSDELGQALHNLSDALLQKIADTNSLFAAACNAANGGVTAPAPAQAAPQPQAQPQQSAWGSQPQAAPASNGAPTNGTPHPEGKQCQQCGTVLQFKQVNRKSDGRTFKFWSCPNGRQKSDGHSSEFAN